MSVHKQPIEVHSAAPVRDPALEPSHEHHHDHHINHTAFAEQGREDEVVYVKGEPGDTPHVPAPGPLDHGHCTQTDKEPIAGDIEALSGSDELGEPTWRGKVRRFVKRHRRHFVMCLHAIIFMLFTGWWVTAVVLHRDKGWIVPFLVYLAILLRLVFFYVPIAWVTKPTFWLWRQTASRSVNMIPPKWRNPLGGLVTVAVILIGSFVSKETPQNTRANRGVSLFGLAVLIFVLWATSRNRKKIVWQTVIVGMLFQFIIALFVLRTKCGYDIFKFISHLATELLDFAKQGTAFLTSSKASQSSWFLASTVPAIMFFVALVQLLYYIGVLQWFIVKFAVFFFWCMRVSGAEAVVAAASPFIGQGESAMLIRPFINHLTMAEIHQIMCSGYATIAGSVLVAYIALGVNPQALVSSCVMSIPASLAVSKMRYPETEETLTAGHVVIPDDDEHRASNMIHAFSNGAWLGLKIGAMITANLLCIISLIGLIDGLLGWWGRFINIDTPLSLHMILGYICYPVAWLLGCSQPDLLKVGQLIGLKIISNEFVAYTKLQGPDYADISSRSRLICTYALCGFANLGSLGNQIGVLAQLAPNRSGDISRVAVSAMITGALSTFTSASMAGLLITDQQTFTKTQN